MNFVSGILENIKKYGKTLDDVEFIASTIEVNNDRMFAVMEHGQINWDYLNFEYDATGEISLKSIIKFNDSSWLERGEYDGESWWEYKKLPRIWDYK